MSCTVGHRHGLDLAWLWLWRRLAPAALSRPLAWEPPYAAGAALKSKYIYIFFMHFYTLYILSYAKFIFVVGRGEGEKNSFIA